MQWLTMSMPDAADRAEPGGELDLGADAVGRGDQHRVVHRRDRLARRTRRRSCRRPAARRGRGCASTAAFICRHGAVALVDVDAGRGVRRERGAERPPADVAADLHAVERGSSPCARRRLRGRRRDRRRCPVTASTRPPATRPSVDAGVERSVVRAVGPITPLADARRWIAAPLDRRRRVPGARRRRRCRRRLRTHDDGGVVERRRRVHGQRELGEVGLDQGQHGLGLGIAEADVVLDQSRPVGGQHQPGVEHADVRRAGGGEVVERPAGRTSRAARRRRTGSAPARTRPCRRCSARCRPRRCACGPGRCGSGDGGVPSHSASSEHSGPVSRSSSTNGPTAAAASIAATVSASSSGTMTPLPAARPSSLTTTGRAERAPPGDRASSASASKRANAGPGMPSDVASSRAYALRRLELGERGGRAEARHAATRALVGHAGDERRLGPGDHEVGVVGRIASPRSAATVTSWPWCRHAQAIACSRPPRPMTSDPHQAEHALEAELGLGLADLDRVAAR